jgi:hypothetical protein
MRTLFKNNYVAIIFSVILFIIPFFWLHPGQMDIGGDETRLFFYDPLDYLYNDGLFLYESIPLESRSFEPHFFNIPFVFTLLVFKSFINSPYFLISVLNGIKVSISFLAVYLIIRTLLLQSYDKKGKYELLQIASMLSGLLYTTAPIVIGNYDKALLSHNQIFLNPLLFYFILLYFLKKQFRYLLITILITLLFASNFSWTSAPPLFAFYPLALLFIFIYVRFILKQSINYREIFLSLILFLGIHAFHLIPEIYNLLNPTSYINQRVFTNENTVIQYLNYYYSVLPSASLTNNLLLTATFKQYVWLSVIPLVYIVLGFILGSKDKNRGLFVLTGIFFLLTLYFVTAKITNIGVKIYELFFYIPGFSMFRNFIGQWAFIFSFFYTLLFGQAIYIVLKRVRKLKVIIIISLIVGTCMVINAWKFFLGDQVNKIHFQSNNVEIPMIIDPAYENTLDFIRGLSDDDAFISFPFTDCCYTIVHGIDDGAYVGPSPLTKLAAKLDYNGYMSISPFGEMFFKLAAEKDYEGIKKLLGVLNVHYIYYNDDPRIYDTAFFGYPYSIARNVFPKTQDEYKTFLKNIVGKEIYHEGTYHIYKTNKNYSNEAIYSPSVIKTYAPYKEELYKQTLPFFESTPSNNDAYLDIKECEKIFSKEKCYKKNIKVINSPEIKFKRINPTSYHIYVNTVKNDYVLVLSRSFSPEWEISLKQDNSFLDIFHPKIINSKHIFVNGYSNAWYISSEDIGNKKNYVLTIQLRTQKVFYAGVAISLVSFVVILFMLVLYVKKINEKDALV